MIAVGADGTAVIVQADEAAWSARASAAWSKLTEDNPACSCCDSASEYVRRVNQVGEILGMPRWDGGWG